MSAKNTQQPGAVIRAAPSPTCPVCLQKVSALTMEEHQKACEKMNKLAAHFEELTECITQFDDSFFLDDIKAKSAAL